MVNGRHSFSGYTDTHLYFDSDGSWKLELYSDSGMFARLKDFNDYPFGVHEWYFSQDSCQDANLTALLSMSACVDSEFQCLDGQCIPMDQRCDGRINCEDRSGRNAS